MHTIRYLAYGSNLHPSRIGARLGAITHLGTTPLPGWALHFHKHSADGSGKCNLVADPSSIAFGVVYEFSSTDKQRLDVIEGVGSGYLDTCIELPEFGQAWVYLADQSHINDSLRPYDWYHAFVLRGAELHQFPSAYVAQIRDVQRIQDPDEKRRTDNQAILDSR
jgi:gamma-glutamylcyclotransferase